MIRFSNNLENHLRQHDVGPSSKDSLEYLKISKILSTYIRNLQEKNVGNGVFHHNIYEQILKKIAKTVQLNLKFFLDTGQLELYTDLRLTFENEKLKLVSKHEIKPTASEDIVCAWIMRVTHCDEDQRFWDHTVFALVHGKDIWYFDFNNAPYTKSMKKLLCKCMPRHNFKAVITIPFLFPKLSVPHDKHHIAMQNGESNILLPSLPPPLSLTRANTHLCNRTP